MPSRDRKEQRERSEDALDRRPDDRSGVLRVSVSPLGVTCESELDVFQEGTGKTPNVGLRGVRWEQSC